ncbi:MAG: hypothetical protein HFJ19_04255 [Clostridia bacterium]|nr:hypothetical protein [Clostridia bacterium]
MDEKNKESKEKAVDTDEIIKETTETINEVKDQVKDSFKKDELKNSAKETTNFIVGMFKNPIGELKNISEDNSNKNFKYAIILAVIWIFAEVILGMFYSSFSWNVIKYLLPLIKIAVAPILSILILSLTIFILNKKKDKSLVTIMSVVTAAKLPIVIASVLSLLKLISRDVRTVTTPFELLCGVISTVLVYFGAKYLLGEKDDKSYIKQFAIIEGIYYIAYIVVGLLQIYI